MGTSECSLVESGEVIQKICSEVIRLSSTCGLTDETLLQACENLGYEHYMSMFPAGIDDILKHVYKSLSNFLILSSNEADFSGLTRIRDRMGYLLKACIRYQASLPHFREYTKELLRYFCSPQHLCFASSITFGVADTMWNLVGDSSVKFDYYTKRLTASGIYFASLMYLGSDTSDNLEDTFAFIDRRIDNVLTFHKFKNKLWKMLGGIRVPRNMRD